VKLEKDQMKLGTVKNGKLEEPIPSITLRDLIAPLFRHRRLVLGVFSGIFILALAVAWLWASRYYVSRMQVVVQQERSDPAVSAGQSAAITSNKPVTMDQVSSEIALLQGPDMLRKVASACGLGQNPSFTDTFLPDDPKLRQEIKQERAATSLSKAIKAQAITTSDVIEVKYGNLGDPQTPACVLQNLSKFYLEKHVQLQRPAGSSDFFAQEAEKYQKALSDSEARLTEFSQKEGISAPDVLRTSIAQQTATSIAALHQAQEAVAADESRIANLRKQLAGTSERSVTSEVTTPSSLLLQNLQATLLAAKVKRAELAVKYDASYPLVRQADDEIAKTQAAIADAEKSQYVNHTTDLNPTYQLLKQDLAKTEADLMAQKATVAAMNEGIHSLQAKGVDLDAKAVKQAALQREAKANEGTYLLYVNKRDQERTSDALDKMRIGNVAIAVPPTVPVVPAHSPVLISIIGLVLGICGGIAAGYLAEYFDPSFRTPAEVADTLSIPVLASVPRQAA
jgi:uncharacterized protein involved in exopolysaccharide biosynthesis